MSTQDINVPLRYKANIHTVDQADNTPGKSQGYFSSVSRVTYWKNRWSPLLNCIKSQRILEMFPSAKTTSDLRNCQRGVWKGPMNMEHYFLKTHHYFFRFTYHFWPVVGLMQIYQRLQISIF